MEGACQLLDTGLGMFCLEVHSHKTKKGALINDIALRFNVSHFEILSALRAQSVVFR